MSTVQMIGLVVAVVVLVVLIVTLVMTRNRGESRSAVTPKETAAPPAPSPTSGSIFAEPPRDELAGLGKPVEAAPMSAAPAATAAGAGAAVAVATTAPAVPPEEPTREAALAAPESAVAASLVADEAPVAVAAVIAAGTVETRGAEPPIEPEASVEPAAGDEAIAASAVEPEPPVAEEGAAPVAAEGSGAPEAAAGVALSDIIVTTNQQQIDLEDPEVRRLVKELIEYEIDLAQQYKEQGQNVDAVLQLTEAEKACNALGLTSKARLIRAMIKELRA